VLSWVRRSWRKSFCETGYEWYIPNFHSRKMQTNIHHAYVRVEALSTVSLRVTVVWDVTSCSLVGVYWRFFAVETELSEPVIPYFPLLTSLYHPMVTLTSTRLLQGPKVLSLLPTAPLRAPIPAVIPSNPYHIFPLPLYSSMLKMVSAHYSETSVNIYHTEELCRSRREVVQCGESP
jgi:hypothetical protein